MFKDEFCLIVLYLSEMVPWYQYKHGCWALLYWPNSYSVLYCSLLVPRHQDAGVCRLLKIKEWVDEHDPGSVIIPFSGAFELDLMDMSDDEKEKYCKENNIQRWVGRGEGFNPFPLTPLIVACGPISPLYH